MQVEPRKDFYSNSKGIQENERNWRRMASSFTVFLAIKENRIRVRLYASPCLLGMKFWLPLPLNPLNAFPPCVVSPRQLLRRPTWGIRVLSTLARESKVVQFHYTVDSKRIARAQKREIEVMNWEKQGSNWAQTHKLMSTMIGSDVNLVETQSAWIDSYPMHQLRLAKVNRRPNLGCGWIDGNACKSKSAQAQ